MSQLASSIAGGWPRPRLAILSGGPRGSSAVDQGDLVLTGDDMGAATCSRWCRLCVGAALCQPTVALGRISSFTLICSRCSHLESWTLLLCPRIFQPLFWCLGVAVEHSVLDILGDPACSPLGWTCGYMFFERLWTIFHNFHVAVNSNREVFAFIHAGWRSVHSRCFWL